MNRLNFREACLLDASGELGKAARREFLAYIRENPAAREEYQDICEAVELLESVPPMEFSADQRREIPAQIKASLRRALAQQEREKQATTRRSLIHHALATVGSIAAAMAVVLAVTLPTAAAGRRHEQDQLAKANAAIEHLMALGAQSVNPYDQAVTDVEASIRQLQAESPTLAQVQDRNMSNLLDALVSVPEDWDDVALNDPAAPGSL